MVQLLHECGGDRGVSDDLTAWIVYVDRWPASSTQTVLRSSTTLDLGRDSQTDGSFAHRAEPGQVQPDRRVRHGQRPSCISFALMSAISRWQLLNRLRDELMKHQIILRGSRCCPGKLSSELRKASYDCGSTQIDKEERDIYKICYLYVF